MKRNPGNRKILRVLSIALVFAMVFSTLGSSGWQVLAEDLEPVEEVMTETIAEAETVAEPETVLESVPELVEGVEATEDIEAEPVEDETVAEPETVPELVEEDEATEDGDETEEVTEEVAEPVEEEPVAEPVPEPVEGTEEAEEAAEEPITEAPAEVEAVPEPVEEEPVDETLIAEAIHVVNEPIEQEAEPSEPIIPAAAEKVAETIAIAYPAQSFRDATDDLSVRVYAPEGVFPADTEMVLTPVNPRVLISAAEESGEENVSSAVAVDIVFVHDGEEVQPKGDVQVTLVARKALKGDTHQAVTMDSEGNTETVGDASATRSTFDTDHFTVYGIIGVDYTDDDIVPYVRHTYVFYVDDVKADEIIVRSGDAFTVPADPAGDAKHTFDGWYEIELAADGKPAKDGDAWKLTTVPVKSLASYDKVAVNEKEDKTIYAAARFNEQYTITLYADEEQHRVLNTITASDKESVDIPAPSTAIDMGLIVPAGEKMTGWKYAGDDGETVKGNSVTIEGADIELVPVFASSHNVKFELVKEIFDAIPEQNVLDGDKVEKPTQYKEGETYKGYRFGGWYTNYDSTKENPDEAFKDEFDFNKELEEGDGDTEGNIVLYAKWIPAEVNYTIEVCLENANDDGYSVISKEEVMGDTDSEIDVAAILEEYHKQKYHKYINNGNPNGPGFFHWAGTGSVNGKTEPCVIQVLNGSGEVVAEHNGTSWVGDAGTISSDEQTVVRVNYCRDTYKLQFLFVDHYDTKTGKNIDITDEANFGSFSGNTTLNDNGKNYAPKGYENTKLPVVDVKFGQSLYEVTHSDPLMGAMFDAFLGDKNWYFEKHNFGSGQTVFNDSNKTFPVRHTKYVPDGGSLYCTAYVKSGQKTYPITTWYYASQEAYESGKDPVKEETTKIVYDSGHKHSFTTGGVSEGYRFVAVTNFDQVFVNDTTGTVIDPDTRQDDVTYKYTFKGGNDPDIEETDPIIKHMVPVTYTITFKQTKTGNINGLNISSDTKEPDQYIMDVPFGSVVDDLIHKNAPAWNELKDDRGVLYTRTGDWLGDDIAPDGSLPKTMPAHDMVFYLDWTPCSYTVIYDPGYEGGKVVEKDNLAWGVRVPDPAELGNNEREGWTLLGWEAYELDRDDDGNRVKGQRIGDGYFTFNTPVKQDLYLVADWDAPEGFQVVYQKGDHGTINGEGTVEDPRHYEAHAKAPVKYTATPDEGWVFTGWAIGGTIPKEVKENGSKVYYGSGDVIECTEANDAAGATNEEQASDKKITLVAQYAKIDRTTSVTYYSNYPGAIENKEETIDGLVVNGAFTLLKPTDPKLDFGDVIIIRNMRYTFLGWTPDPQNHTHFADMDSAMEALDFFLTDMNQPVAAGEGTNKLYAIWQVIYLSEKTTVSGEKKWVGDEDVPGKRPDSITVRLHASDESVPEQVLTVRAEDGWKFSFEELPKYTKYGDTIRYEVSEDRVYNYSTSIDELTYTITNTYTPGFTSVGVEKIWHDKNDQDGIRPQSVTVKLLANGEEVQEAILSADNNWEYDFENLPLNGEDGKPIDYRVEEDVPAGYTVSYSGSAETDFIITNTHTPETVRISGTKTWDDAGDQDGIRPETISVKLLADGVQVAHKNVTAEDGWKYSFEDLPKYAHGKLIEYTLGEHINSGYEAIIDGYDITNRHVPETVDIEGRKIWDDNDDQDGKRPESITVRLHADGKAVPDMMREVTAADEWVFSFTGLPKFAKGHEIRYTITEDAIDDYASEIDEHTYTITNRYTPDMTSVEVEKVWNDEYDRDGIRPAKITVSLLADGEVCRTVELTEDNEWEYTFNELPAYEDGERIVYTVREDAVANGYTVSYSGNEDVGYLIINTYEGVPEEPDTPGGGSDRPRRPETPETPEEEIPEDEVPLDSGEGDGGEGSDDPGISEETSEEPGEDYEAGYEETEEMTDEDLPLTPFTGDDRHTAAWGFLSILSLAGIELVGRKRREE